MSRRTKELLLEMLAKSILAAQMSNAYGRSGIELQMIREKIRQLEIAQAEVEQVLTKDGV